MDVIETLARRAVRDGDGTALQALFGEARDPLYHFLLRRLGNSADAEDAAQDTFREALRSMSSLREPRAFRGWLYRIALRVAGRVRRSRTAPVAVPITPAEPSLMNLELREHLTRAVDALDEDHRTTVRLRYEQDLSYEEIAEAMDCPPGTVAKRLHTAHGRLRELLAGAGLVLALSQISKALESMPRVSAPAPLAEALLRMVRETGVPPVTKAHPIPTKAAVVTAVAILLVGVAFLAHRWRNPRSGVGSVPSVRPAPAAGPVAAAPSPSSSGATAPPNVQPAPTAAAQVAGIVRDRQTGRPIPGARVTFGRKEAEPVQAITNSFGAYSAAVPEGEYEVSASAEGYVEHSLVCSFERVRLQNTKGEAAADAFLAEQPLHVGPKGTVTRDFELLTAAEIRGMIVDGSGAALPGVRVEFWGQIDPVGGCTHSYRPAPPDSLVSGPDGHFVIPGLFPEGTCMLRFTAQGCEVVEERVTLEHGRGNVTVRLLPGLAVRVVVLDSNGLPVAGAVLMAGGEHFKPAAETTDAGGGAVLKDLPRDTRAVAAYAPGCGAAVADLRSAPAAGIRLILPPGDSRIAGTVVDEEGRPLPGVRVLLHHLDASLADAPGELTFMNQGVGRTCAPWGRARVGFLPLSVVPPSTMTGSDGRFALEGMPHSGAGVCLEFELAGFDRLRRVAGSTEMGQVRLVRESSSPGK